MKEENDRIKRDLGKAVGVVRQRQEEVEKLTKANNGLKEDNRDLSTYLDKQKSDNDRLSAEYDRVKVGSHSTEVETARRGQLREPSLVEREQGIEVAAQ